jgi:PiT family inorganic phosphate transporter
MLMAVIVFALIFDFLNGFHDSSNVVATAIASRALNPRPTLYLAAAAHLAAPFIFGFAVAKTVGEGLLRQEVITPPVVLAALIAAVAWNLLTWYAGIPSSSSHALVGGLMGASILSAGFGVIQLGGLRVVLLALFLSPVLGLLAGFAVMRLTLWAARKASPKINVLFRRMQIVTLTALALSHGTNDAQKTMGVITLGLVAAGQLDRFEVPLWVVAVSGGAIALGTAFGGWRLIRTLGGRIMRIRPVDGFASQVAGTVVILGAALLGGPVSTTQVMSSSIMGAGAAQRLSRVRWLVAREMMVAWLLTIPVTAALAALCYLALMKI